MKQASKQFLNLLPCAVMVPAMLSATAFAATKYNYVDESGDIRQVEATEVGSRTTEFTDSGDTGVWYSGNKAESVCGQNG